MPPAVGRPWLLGFWASGFLGFRLNDACLGLSRADGNVNSAESPDGGLGSDLWLVAAVHVGLGGLAFLGWLGFGAHLGLGYLPKRLRSERWRGIRVTD